MEPARFTPGDRLRRRLRASSPPPNSVSRVPLSPHSPLFCKIFCMALWVDPRWKSRPFPSLVPGPGGCFTRCSALPPRHPAGCTASDAGLAVRWPRRSPGPPPRRPRRACEGLIPTASDKGSSCKTLICCLQTRLWGMLENLKVNVSLASGIK